MQADAASFLLRCSLPQLDLTDLTWQKRKYERWSAYGASKLANVLFSQELARREGAAGTGACRAERRRPLRARERVRQGRCERAWWV